MISILLFLAIIPVVIICTYIYKKDKNKEPWSLLIKLFVLGIASCFLVLLLSELLFKIFPFMEKESDFMTFFELMAYAFIGVAFIEELCKFLMAYIGAYSNKAYDEVYDGIVYAVYVSLGFACFENLLYVFSNQSIAVGIARGLLAVPGHACDAVFMGYYLSLAKVYGSQGKKNLERRNLILSVLVPTILHGIYDFCLFTNIEIFLLVFFAFVITIYILSIKNIKYLAAQCKNTPTVQQPMYQQASYQNQQMYNNMNYQQPVYNNMMGYQQPSYGGNVGNATGYQQPMYNNQNNYYQQVPTIKYCSKCGAVVNGDFCMNCGTRQN